MACYAARRVYTGWKVMPAGFLRSWAREAKVLYPPEATIGELLALTEAAHPAIMHPFGTGIGHRLQFTESKILVSTLVRAMRSAIVVLPVHDCVVWSLFQCPTSCPLAL